MSTAPFRDREVRSGRRPHREAPERERDRSANDCVTISVTNLPIGFTWRDVKDLFTNQVGDVKYAEVGNDGTGIVEFASWRMADVAVSTMNGYRVNGQQIFIKMDVKGEYRQKIKNDVFNTNKVERHLDEQPNYYGLSKKFVESLNLTLPLVNRAFVMNMDFRVDKAKLKEIFSLAGKVHQVQLWTGPDGVSKGMAVIQYDHPVEVVQAISMFNKQMLYDRPMVVRMDRSPNREFSLPEGLGGVGPGLGVEGAPLRNVAFYIMKQEEEQAKELNESTDNFPKDNRIFNNSSMGKMGSTKNEMIDWPDNQMKHSENQMNNPDNQMKHPGNQMNHPDNQMKHPGNQMNHSMWSSNFNSMNSNQQMSIPNVQIGPMDMPMNMNLAPNAMNVMPTVNAMVGSSSAHGPTTPNSSNVGGGGDNNVSAQTLMALLNLQNQIQQQGLSVSELPRLLSMMGNQGGPDNRSNPGALAQHVEGTSYRDSNAPDRPKAYQSDMVTVTNLPHNVTPQMVHDKFGEAGNVKFVEMTAPGSALVRFTANWAAEQAIKMFDGTRVNGMVIDVAYF